MGKCIQFHNKISIIDLLMLHFGNIKYIKLDYKGRLDYI